MLPLVLSVLLTNALPAIGDPVTIAPDPVASEDLLALSAYWFFLDLGDSETAFSLLDLGHVTALTGGDGEVIALSRPSAPGTIQPDLARVQLRDGSKWWVPTTAVKAAMASP